MLLLALLAIGHRCSPRVPCLGFDGCTRCDVCCFAREICRRATMLVHVEIDQLVAQSYRKLNERTLMGRSHKGVKWDRPFVVSGMLKSHKNFHDCCQFEIEGFVSFRNAEAKTQNSPPSGGNLRRVEGAPLPQTSFVATSCPAAR